MLAAFDPIADAAFGPVVLARAEPIAPVAEPADPNVARAVERQQALQHKLKKYG